MEPQGPGSDLPWQSTELQRIVDFTPALILTAQPNGAVDFFNQRWFDFVGVPTENLLGWGWTAYIHPDDLDEFIERWRAAIRSGEQFEAESRVRRADGEFRWMLHQGIPLLGPDCSVLKWFGCSIDIEARKQAEGELKAALVEIHRLKDQLHRENIALRQQIDKTSLFEEIVGSSPALNAVLTRVARVGPTDSTVLIIGETGTGKELIARAIHKRSQRSAKPFISVNCAAIPRDLIGSELFGHEKGSFTGATQRRLGHFELAEGGTLFLDEVGDLPHETQVALLRVLQEHEFERVGGNSLIRSDARVIAATNRDLEAAMANGSFRTDLFYRLNVFPIETPPLRERKEDIPLLVEYFVDRYARKAGKTIRFISKRTLELLQQYPWPGNVRELQNIIERSVILCDSENFSVDPSWLSRRAHAADVPQASELFEHLAAREKEIIEAALRDSSGRVFGPLGAASKLGIARSTLESRIRSLNIDKHRFRSPDHAS